MTTPTLEIVYQEALDEDTGDPCEGPTHSLGLRGHNPAERASWLLIPICGHDWLSCNSWLQGAIEHYGNQWYIECAKCGTNTDCDELGRIYIAQ